MRFAVSVAADPGASPRRRGLHRRASDKEAGREARLVLVRLTIHGATSGPVPVRSTNRELSGPWRDLPRLGLTLGIFLFNGDKRGGTDSRATYRRVIAHLGQLEHITSGQTEVLQRRAGDSATDIQFDD